MWNRNLIRDTFIGQVHLEAHQIHCTMEAQMILKDRKDPADAQTVPGRLSLEYTTEEDFLLI